MNSPISIRDISTALPDGNTWGGGIINSGLRPIFLDYAWPSFIHKLSINLSIAFFSCILPRKRFASLDSFFHQQWFLLFFTKAQIIIHAISHDSFYLCCILSSVSKRHQTIVLVIAQIKSLCKICHDWCSVSQKFKVINWKYDMCKHTSISRFRGYLFSSKIDSLSAIQIFRGVCKWRD